MSLPVPIRLLEAYGVELEYMIVDRDTLDVRPVSDQVLKAVAGEYVSEVEVGEAAWSNELVLHVIEIKTNGPAARLEGLEELFQESVGRINGLLSPLGAILLPSAMHPWMDPQRETRLWPHEYDVVYESFNRIFDCRGHGWANLQSLHLNLPFGDSERDEGEFGRLHAAIRLLLPLLPALAASSPVRDGRVTGLADSRLEVYANNSARVPSVSGMLIPEAIFNRRDYEEILLGRIYADLEPHDPQGVLRHEWVNARGAIARFDRNTIEIRLLDMQECPQADLAIVALIESVLRALIGERWSDLDSQQSWAPEPLAEILQGTIALGEDHVIADAPYLRTFGLDRPRSSACDLWRHLLEEVWPAGSDRRRIYGSRIETILTQGTLARRIVRAIAGDITRERIAAVYRRLAECLSEGRMFRPQGTSG